MSKPNKTQPDLSLSVQYGLQEARLPRWRLRRWVQRAVQAAYTDGLVQFDRVQLSIRLVAAKEGRALNASYRQKDYATNVLTFEYGVMPDGTASGDIVVFTKFCTNFSAKLSLFFLIIATQLNIVFIMLLD